MHLNELLKLWNIKICQKMSINSQNLIFWTNFQRRDNLRCFCDVKSVLSLLPSIYVLLSINSPIYRKVKI